MTNLRQLPKLPQLKKSGAIDEKSYEEILASLEKNQRILILSPRNSGKNTIQNAIVNHLHRLFKETLVIPSVESVPTKKFKSLARLKNLKRMAKEYHSCVAIVKYLGTGKADITELTKYLLDSFDLIIE